MKYQLVSYNTPTGTRTVLCKEVRWDAVKLDRVGDDGKAYQEYHTRLIEPQLSMGLGEFGVAPEDVKIESRLVPTGLIFQVDELELGKEPKVELSRIPAENH